MTWGIPGTGVSWTTRVDGARRAARSGLSDSTWLAMTLALLLLYLVA
jgi:hypothetical protein